MMKTTKKDIIELVKNLTVADITNYTQDDLNRLCQREHSFTKIAYSAGTYGITAMVVRGDYTRELYAVTERNYLMFALNI